MPKPTKRDIAIGVGFLILGVALTLLVLQIAAPPEPSTTETAPSPSLLTAAQGLRHWLEGLTNNLGRAVLELLWWFALPAALLCAAKVYRGTGKGDPLEVARAALGVGHVAGAIAIACAFLLTEPPAIEALDHTLRMLLGVVAGVSLFTIGWRESFARAFPKKAEPVDVET